MLAESGGARITLLDGDRLEPVHRFALRGVITGEPQFSPDGRNAYFATRDGWISKFDLRQLKTVAEARAGSETLDLALSTDGKFLAAGNAAPQSLAVFDAELHPVKTLAAADATRRRSSPVTQVRNAPARRSFVAALPGIAELWEVSYDPAAPELADGLVHDYKLREGAFVSGFLHPRRTPLEAAIEEFHLLPDGRRLAGIARASDRGQLIHLDARRRIGTLERDGFEAIGERHADLSARLRAASGRPLAELALDRYGRYALANLPEAPDALLVYDASTLREVKRLSMSGAVRKYNVFNEIRRHSGNSHQP